MSPTFVPMRNFSIVDSSSSESLSLPPPLPPQNRRRFYRLGKFSRRRYFFLGLAIGLIILIFGIWAFMHHESKIDALEKFQKKSQKQTEDLYNEVCYFQSSLKKWDHPAIFS